MALRPTGRAIAETLGRGIIHATFAWQTPLGGPCAANVGYAAGRVYTEITRVTARQSRDLLLISGRVARQHSRAWNYPRPFLRDQPLTWARLGKISPALHYMTQQPQLINNHCVERWQRHAREGCAQ